MDDFLISGPNAHGPAAPAGRAGQGDADGDPRSAPDSHNAAENDISHEVEDVVDDEDDGMAAFELLPECNCSDKTRLRLRSAYSISLACAQRSEDNLTVSQEWLARMPSLYTDVEAAVFLEGQLS